MHNRCRSPAGGFRAWRHEDPDRAALLGRIAAEVRGREADRVFAVRLGDVHVVPDRDDRKVGTRFVASVQSEFIAADDKFLQGQIVADDEFQRQRIVR